MHDNEHNQDHDDPDLAEARALNARVAGLAAPGPAPTNYGSDPFLVMGINLANDDDRVGQLGALIQLRQRGVTDRFALAKLMGTSVVRVSELEAQADIYLSEVAARHASSPSTQRALLSSQLEALQAVATGMVHNVGLSPSDRLRAIDAARKIIESRGKLDGLLENGKPGTTVNIDNRNQTAVNVGIENGLSRLGLSMGDIAEMVRESSMAAMSNRIIAQNTRAMPVLPPASPTPTTTQPTQTDTPTPATTIAR